MPFGTKHSKVSFNIDSSKPVFCYYSTCSLVHFCLQNSACHTGNTINIYWINILQHTIVINEKFKELSVDDFNGEIVIAFLEFHFCPTIDIAAFSDKVIHFMVWIVTLLLFKRFPLWPEYTPRKTMFGPLIWFNQISQGCYVLLERSGPTLRSLFITNPDGHQTQGWTISQWAEWPNTFYHAVLWGTLPANQIPHSPVASSNLNASKEYFEKETVL